MIQVIMFEGLGFGMHLRRSLMKGIEKHPEVAVWCGSFTRKGPLAVNPSDRHIVVGHSMGGPSAIWWCKQFPALEIDLLLTLDPRPLHRPYVKPANVKRAVNFHRGKGGLLTMQGYPVEGAVNNYRPKWGHTGMPYEREVLDVLMEAIG